MSPTSNLSKEITFFEFNDLTGFKLERGNPAFEAESLRSAYIYTRLAVVPTQSFPMTQFGGGYFPSPSIFLAVMFLLAQKIRVCAPKLFRVSSMNCKSVTMSSLCTVGPLVFVRLIPMRLFIPSLKIVTSETVVSRTIKTLWSNLLHATGFFVLTFSR